MGLVAERTGILEPLRRLVRETTIPVFGTCAGMILLADRAEHSKTGGQPLIGGLDITVDRNHFGAQSKSFEADVDVTFPGGPMHGVFIRAPAIIECGPGVEVLGTVAHEGNKVIVAARQGRLLVCAFHVLQHQIISRHAPNTYSSPSLLQTSACTKFLLTWPSRGDERNEENRHPSFPLFDPLSVSPVRALPAPHPARLQPYTDTPAVAGMVLKLDIKRQLSSRSDRVKSVDLHPTEPWMLVALYVGQVHVWNIDTQAIIKTFEVTELPVRAAKFVVRKNWVVTGSVSCCTLPCFEGSSSYVIVDRMILPSVSSTTTL